MKNQLSVSLVSNRLNHLINYQYWHSQKQCYADYKNSSIRVYGIGSDRWHFRGNKKTKFLFLISLYSVSDYLYYNYNNFPCPVVELMTDQSVKRFWNFVEHKGESWLKPIGKPTIKEKKLAMFQGYIESMKRGVKTGFANPIGKKKKKR